MKTLRWLLLSLFCCTSVMVNAQVKDAVTLAINEIKAGTTWNVDVAFENAASGNYTAFQMDLKIPEGFVYEEFSLATDLRLFGHTCSAHMGTDGLLHIMAYSANNAAIMGNTGKLFSLTLAVQPGTPEGQYRVVPQNVRFAKRDGNEYSIDANSVDFTFKLPAAYNVIYMVDGQEFSRQAVNAGQSIPAVQQPVKEGYTFTGWKDIPSVMPTHDITVEAIFTVNKYKLVFQVGNEIIQSTEVAYGDSIVVPDAPVRTGLVFLGWGNVASVMPAHDLTYTGNFAMIGDVNKDGAVDVSDITTVVNIILQDVPNQETDEMTIADVNGDGEVDVSDITEMVNIILHQ